MSERCIEVNGARVQVSGAVPAELAQALADLAGAVQRAFGDCDCDIRGGQVVRCARHQAKADETARQPRRRPSGTDWSVTS